MFDNPIYNYPVTALLKVLGCREEKKNMYFSPLRSEKSASLHVDEEKNLWYDHGAGVGGTNVQLVMLVRHCSEREAAEWIASLAPATFQHLETQKTPTPKLELAKVEELSNYFLKKYLAERKIPFNLAKRYCKQVTTVNGESGKKFTVLGFENNAGGYALRSPGIYKATNRAGITTINVAGERNILQSSKSVAVFEGFFDYLSWLVLQSTERPSCDVVVLNSVNNLDKAIAYMQLHSTILTFLDRDEAGRRTQERIASLFPDKQIKDMSELYKEHKDLNEMLVTSRGYGQQNSIKR